MFLWLENAIEFQGDKGTSSPGSSGALTQISVNFGILLTQTLGLFLSESTPNSHVFVDMGVNLIS